MKTINYIMVAMAVAVMAVACADGVQREASYCLKQDYRYVKDQPLVDARLVREVPNTENYNATSITVLDSLGVVQNWSIGGSGNVFSLLNINTGEEYGSFCPDGRGPKDMTFGSNVMCKPKVVDGEIVVMVYDHRTCKIFTWNVTRTLKNGHTVYDEVKQLPENLNRYSWLYALNDGCYLNFESNVTLDVLADDKEVIRMPKFQTRSAEDLSLIREYDIYADSVKVCDNFTSHLVNTRAPHITHKGNKAISNQLYVPQINILDLKSGEVDAIRIKGEEVGKDAESICDCYGDFDSDEKYIYALYDNSSTLEGEKITFSDDLEAASAYYKNTPTQVHVFDYDGNLVGRYKLDGLYSTISVYDGKLYAHVHYSGRLTEYDLGLK